MRRLRHQEHGYTFVELVFVIVIGTACVGFASELYLGADELSNASRHRMDSASDLRNAHTRVGARFRNASLSTMTNLDSTATDHAPRFQTVDGMADGAILLSDPMEIAYARTHADLEGMGPVGHLVYRVVGESAGEILATNVVEGSWSVTLDARVVQVTFGVVTAPGGQDPLSLTTSTAVFLENP